MKKYLVRKLTCAFMLLMGTLSAQAASNSTDDLWFIYNWGGNNRSTAPITQAVYRMYNGDGELLGFYTDRLVNGESQMVFNFKSTDYNILTPLFDRHLIDIINTFGADAWYHNAYMHTWPSQGGVPDEFRDVGNDLHMVNGIFMHFAVYQDIFNGKQGTHTVAVKRIGNKAFAGMTILNGYKVPEFITEIDGSAFPAVRW